MTDDEFLNALIEAMMKPIASDRLEPRPAPRLMRECSSDFCPDHPRGAHRHVKGETMLRQTSPPRKPWEMPPIEVGPDMRAWFDRAQEADREPPPVAVLATVIGQLLQEAGL
jgi:hypothetical protein